MGTVIPGEPSRDPRLGARDTRPDLRGPRLDGLQIARAFAAFLVVVCHTQNLFETYHDRVGLKIPAFAHHVLEIIGTAGVDIFFVISGFIILFVAYDHFGEKAYQIEFLKKRFLRVAVLYWIYTSVMLGVFLFLPGVIHTARHLSGLKVLTSYLFIPFDDQGDRLPILMVGWSLNYEVFFYLVFAIFLPLRRSLSVPSILSSLLALSLGSLALVRNGIHFPGDWFLSSTMFLEFLAGMLLCLLYKSGRRWRTFGLGSLLGLAILVFLSLTYGFPGDAERGLLWTPSAVLIVWDFIMLSNVHPLPLPLVRLGDASYSLYLSHFFVGVAFARLYLKIWPEGSPSLLYALLLIVPCGAAWLLYRYGEKPLLHFIQLPSTVRRIRSENRPHQK